METRPNGALARRLASGLIGAVALTGLNEGVRRVRSEAPRLDRLGTKALGALFERIFGRRPTDRTLYGLALAGDVASNAGYYSTLLGRHGSVARVALGGVTAGLGAVLVPHTPAFDDARPPAKVSTQVLTVAYYTAGALVAWGVYRLLTRAART